MPFDKVHLKVLLVPTGTPDTVVLKVFVLAIEAVPLTTVHVLVIEAGLLPDIVKLPLLH